MQISKKQVIKSDDEQIVFAVVYSPMEIDTDGEAATPYAIRQAAHKFLSSGKIDKIDLLHNGIETGSEVIESFVVRGDDDPDGFAKDDWVIGVKINDPDLWSAIKKGEINGFSLGGSSIKVPATVIVSEIQSLAGITEKNTDSIIPEHFHELELSFDEKGKLLPTYTKEAMGHSHFVKALTATEIEGAHAHRLIVEDEEYGTED